MENDADVVEVEDLVYSKATTRKYRWVVAVPENSDIHSVKDLEGKRIATELVEATRRYLARHGVHAEVEYSWGATEIKAPNLVDAIVEGTETGSSLRANRLRIVDTVVESNTKLIANKDAWADPWKRDKIERLALLLKGALEAEAKVGLKMNVPRDRLDEVVARASRPAHAHHLQPDRRRLGGHRGDHRRAHRARPDPQTKARRGLGDHRVPAEQGDLLGSESKTQKKEFYMDRQDTQDGKGSLSWTS